MIRKQGPFSVLTILIILGSLIIACDKSKDHQYITIGTGEVTGVYYPLGGAISRLINDEKENDFQISVNSSAGSVENINALVSNELQLAFVQSDRQYQAFNGIAEWKNSGKQDKLRSICALHTEAVTLVASKRSKIKSIGNLSGKRINIGVKGSGQIQNALDVLRLFGMNEKSIKPYYLDMVDTPGMIQEKKLDAFFYTVGHPNSNLKEATGGKEKIRFINISGRVVSNFVKKFPYYTETVIPQRFYTRILNKKDVKTFGVKATLITSADVPENIIYTVTKVIFEHLDALSKMHPALETLTKKDMFTGLTAPLHPGAVKYYREANIIDLIKPTLIVD